MKDKIELPISCPNLVIDLELLCDKKYDNRDKTKKITFYELLMELLTPPEGYYEALLEAMKVVANDKKQERV